MYIHVLIAHGLAFSVQKGIPPPPSLKNIFIELKVSIHMHLYTYMPTYYSHIILYVLFISCLRVFNLVHTCIHCYYYFYNILYTNIHHVHIVMYVRMTTCCCLGLPPTGVW